ncbi:hypothetical protein ABKN59_009291 [Abortiporus biennis]
MHRRTSPMLEVAEDPAVTNENMGRNLEIGKSCVDGRRVSSIYLKGAHIVDTSDALKVAARGHIILALCGCLRSGRIYLGQIALSNN